jgi:hypothetical protein
MQPDRRHQPDRRKSSTLIHKATGQRAAPRRRADAIQKPYVDLYSWRSLGLILAVLAMSILDGFFTLHLMDIGAQEVNPIMRHALARGPIFFLVAKYALTGSALVLLLIHKEFYLFRGRVRAKYFFLIFLMSYFVLVIYELILIFYISPKSA